MKNKKKDKYGFEDLLAIYSYTKIDISRGITVVAIILFSLLGSLVVHGCG